MGLSGLAERTRGCCRTIAAALCRWEPVACCVVLGARDSAPGEPVNAGKARSLGSRCPERHSAGVSMWVQAVVVLQWDALRKSFGHRGHTRKAAGLPA